MIWRLSRLTLDDLAVIALDKSHVREMADIHAKTFSRAWTDGEFTDLLDKSNVFGFCLIEPASRGGHLAGFVLARHAADEAEILTIAVSPNWQGYGAGRRLMDCILAEAHAMRLAVMFLEVDEANKPARALYRRLGFAEVAKRPDYYEHGKGRRTSALVMRRELS